MSDRSRQHDDDDARLTEAHALIMALMEEQLAPDQAERFEQLICSDPEARRLYVKYLHQRCAVAAMSHGASSMEDIAADVSADMPAILRPISDPVAPVAPDSWHDDVHVDPSAVQVLRSTRYVHRRGRRSMPRWLLRAAAVVLLIVGITILYQRWPATSVPTSPSAVAQAPAPQPALAPPSPSPQQAVAPGQVYVARLTREFGARWSGGVDAATQPGQHGELAENAKLSLAEGLAELTFATGATVVLEAPSQFSVRHNAITVPAGKLAATVTPSATGFIVNTPQSTITDLGTEFGVTVTGSGETRVDVFKGRVTAQPVMSSTQPVELIAGRAASVTGGKLALDPLGAIPQRFVRQVRSTATTLDLVDLICGGDGTTHRRGAAIDMLSGAYGALAPRGTVQGKNNYRRVDLSVVDGCFLPNGRTQIDSAGNRFNFGRTQGRTFDHIRAGGKFKWARADSAAQFSPVLDGVNYGSGKHGFVLLHANGGLTLDLSAIRRLHPGRSIERFQSLLGNTAEGSRATGKKQPPQTTAWVVVDGKERFKQTFTNQDKPINVDVAIQPGDRFMTLVITDSSESIHLDWVIFADPQLRLGDQ